MDSKLTLKSNCLFLFSRNTPNKIQQLVPVEDFLPSVLLKGKKKVYTFNCDFDVILLQQTTREYFLEEKSRFWRGDGGAFRKFPDLFQNRQKGDFCSYFSFLSYFKARKGSPFRSF